MTFVASERPGIYPDYDSSSITYSSNGTNTVAIVAKAPQARSEISYISRPSDAVSLFGNDSSLTKLCTVALKNGAYNVAAIAVDNTTPDYANAFNKISSEENISVVLCDSEDLTVHKLLESSVDTASDNMMERIGIIGCSSDENIVSWAGNFNNERIVLIVQNPVDDTSSTLSSNYIAASLGGLISKCTNPSIPFNGITLEGLNALASDLSENDVDNYIKNGITAFECVDSKISIIRAVTSRRKTNNKDDSTFKDLNTTLVIDHIVSSIRSCLNSFMNNAKNNETTRASIKTQTTIKLEEYRLLNIIDSYEQPDVHTLSDDPSVCVVKINFAVTRGLNQINISAHIKV